MVLFFAAEKHFPTMVLNFTLKVTHWNRVKFTEDVQCGMQTGPTVMLLTPQVYLLSLTSPIF